jgi:hypothetical protein
MNERDDHDFRGKQSANNRRRGYDLEQVSFQRSHLALRSARRARLKGWVTSMLLRTHAQITARIRDALLRNAPQGEAVWFRRFGTSPTGRRRGRPGRSVGSCSLWRGVP